MASMALLCHNSISESVVKFDNNEKQNVAGISEVYKLCTPEGIRIALNFKGNNNNKTNIIPTAR